MRLHNSKPCVAGTGSVVVGVVGGGGVATINIGGGGGAHQCAVSCMGVATSDFHIRYCKYKQGGRFKLIGHPAAGRSRLQITARTSNVHASLKLYIEAGTSSRDALRTLSNATVLCMTQGRTRGAACLVQLDWYSPHSTACLIYLMLEVKLHSLHGTARMVHLCTVQLEWYSLHRRGLNGAESLERCSLIVKSQWCILHGTALSVYLSHYSLNGTACMVQLAQYSLNASTAPLARYSLHSTSGTVQLQRYMLYGCVVHCTSCVVLLRTPPPWGAATLELPSTPNVPHRALDGTGATASSGATKRARCASPNSQRSHRLAQAHETCRHAPRPYAGSGTQYPGCKTRAACRGARGATRAAAAAAVEAAAAATAAVAAAVAVTSCWKHWLCAHGVALRRLTGHLPPVAAAIVPGASAVVAAIAATAAAVAEAALAGSKRRRSRHARAHERMHVVALQHWQLLLPNTSAGCAVRHGAVLDELEAGKLLCALLGGGAPHGVARHRLGPLHGQNRAAGRARAHMRARREALSDVDAKVEVVATEGFTILLVYMGDNVWRKGL
eukprot:364644-Chlamydomonas_euryale.AAC.15